MTRIPEDLRHLVIERAKGCCEYCLIPEDEQLFAHEIDHIVPEKHHGKTVDENLCYSCMKCNRHKGSDFASIDPETKEIIRLFNPRKDTWSEHFRLEGVQIEALTPEGQVTIFVLKLNENDRLIERAVFLKSNRYPCK